MSRSIRRLVSILVMVTATLSFAGPAAAGTCPIDRFITTGSCW